MIDRQKSKTHTAHDYGRNAEPLPDLHIFSKLSELDADYAAELANRRARQETLEREIAELAKRLASPLHSVDAEPHRDLRNSAKRS
jgi:hypothetical protein